MSLAGSRSDSQTLLSDSETHQDSLRTLVEDSIELAIRLQIQLTNSAEWICSSEWKLVVVLR